jgi:hypothetical protein
MLWKQAYFSLGSRSGTGEGSGPYGDFVWDLRSSFARISSLLGNRYYINQSVGKKTPTTGEPL